MTELPLFIAGSDHWAPSDLPICATSLVRSSSWGSVRAPPAVYLPRGHPGLLTLLPPPLYLFQSSLESYPTAGIWRLGASSKVLRLSTLVGPDIPRPVPLSGTRSLGGTDHTLGAGKLKQSLKIETTLLWSEGKNGRGMGSMLYMAWFQGWVAGNGNVTDQQPGSLAINSP